MRANGVFISRTFSTIIRNHHSSYHHFNSEIKSLVQQGNYRQALQFYSEHLNFPNNITSRFIFPSLLKSCASLSNSIYGSTLHSTIIKLGLLFDPYIVTSLVQMYVKCGSLATALQVFDFLPEREILTSDVALWNSIIDGYFKNDFIDQGIAQIRQMVAMNVKPDGYTLCILLGKSNACLGVSFGREIHSYAIRNMFLHDAFVVTAMIDIYSSYGRPMDAWNAFVMLENKHSIAVWNAMINGFCENGVWRNSLQLYSSAKNEALELGSTTFSSVLTACSLGEAVDFGCQVHSDLVKMGFEQDSYASTSLLTFYAKCGVVEDAECVFNLVRDRTVGIWNSMVSAYVNCGNANNALDVYTKMRSEQVEPDFFTVSNVLIACGMIGSHQLGERTHGELIKRPVKQSLALQSALLTMYSKLGRFKESCKVFKEMRGRDVVSWGSMISGSLENRKFEEVLVLFKGMISEGVKPDASVVASSIVACLAYGDEKLGCCLHGMSIKEGLDLDSCTGRALIEFYSKFKKVEMAEEAFSSVLVKNLAVWNAFILCNSLNGFPNISISLLPRVLQDGLCPDSVSVTLALAAAAELAALLVGKAIHGYIIRSLLFKENQVENTLVDMYAKCGSLVYAERVFRNMEKRDIVAWNSMIGGYGSHGECHRAIGMLEEMRDSGESPDGVTFLSLISSCNHSGLVDKGLSLFRSMRESGVEPKMAHYVTVVDLLGRGGRVEEAWEFVEGMAMAPERGIWLSLLSSCKVHRRFELGEAAAYKLLEMEPENGGGYVQLLNLYVEGGFRQKAAELRSLMKEMGVRKVAGCSWIEVKDKVEVFYSGGTKIVRICETLDGLRSSMKKGGCGWGVGEALL
ncbi:pentatricopeptide repeat-containing protein At2g40720 [Salvia hispanica]|uniref:pentatricopeptide repeat-containing protein At2g40720 n=1 Tax=Salvia hispanica TaxID=49212 RepID=UPI0020094E36|nr:pentatricopeptide repeat-containing protein At2g40720 [Salvia hispanica]